MQIQIANNKKMWDSFVLENEAIFTQSWDWGNILAAEGKKVEMILVLEGEKIVAATLVTYSFFPLGIKYAFCSWGPVLSKDFCPRAGECLDVLAKYFSDQGCVFARVEPLVCSDNIKLKKVKDVSPSHTLIVDTQKNDEELLASFEKKTRYEIRQAQKNNLEIKEWKDFDIFWSLMKKTATHDGFRPHSEEHYRKILENENSIQLNAYYHGQPIATAIFWKWNGVFTYLFAATDRNFSSLSAAYLIQWEAIRTARQLGLSKYDLFGVAPKISPASHPYDYDRKHRYAGFTKFKLGFGGEYRALPGTFDLILRPAKYYFYKILRSLRRLV